MENIIETIIFIGKLTLSVMERILDTLLEKIISDYSAEIIRIVTRFMAPCPALIRTGSVNADDAVYLVNNEHVVHMLEGVVEIKIHSDNNFTLMMK